MDIAILERAARIAAGAAVAFAWAEASIGIAAAQRKPQQVATGLARRIGVMPAYAVVAIPYFIICALLWRPLPIELVGSMRVIALVVGFEMGIVGTLLYIWGRRSLGGMYQLSGTLGTGLHEGHQLVVTGPYQMMRHPMYAGIILGALGGLVLYRTWTFGFVLAGIPGMVRRARTEDRLLAAAFGPDFESYRRVVPAWFPRPGCVRRSFRGTVSPDARRFLPRNLDAGGRWFRGLVIAPGAAVIALSGIPPYVALPFAVTAVLSVITALSGHCFICDVHPQRRVVDHH